MPETPTKPEILKIAAEKGDKLDSWESFFGFVIQRKDRTATKDMKLPLEMPEMPKKALSNMRVLERRYA